MVPIARGSVQWGVAPHTTQLNLFIQYQLRIVLIAVIIGFLAITECIFNADPMLAHVVAYTLFVVHVAFITHYV